MTSERSSRPSPTRSVEPCRCALCLALLDAAIRAERLRAERRATMRVVDGQRR